MALISTAFLIPVLITFAQTGMVPNFPTLIVCCFVYLAAMLSFFAGMILDTQTQKNRHDFEMQLQNVDRYYKRLLCEEDEK